MIFLTVGTQLPFDRLVRTLDEWCEKNPSQKVFGQIAEPGPNGYIPKNFEWKSFIDPEEFTLRFSKSKLIVAHAGMGSIISALTHPKPILIMPRRLEFREHRNDHQMATAKRFENRDGVITAFEEQQVRPLLDSVLKKPSEADFVKVGEFAEQKLLDAIRDFIMK